MHSSFCDGITVEPRAQLLAGPAHAHCILHASTSHTPTACLDQNFPPSLNQVIIKLVRQSSYRATLLKLGFHGQLHTCNRIRSDITNCTTRTSQIT